jgi:hypothetical protein
MCSSAAFCSSLCRWLPVLFVVSLIGWCYFVYVFDILSALLQLAPGVESKIGTRQTGVTYMVIFNSLFALGMLSFVRAVFTHPGRIPDSWIVGAEDTEKGAFVPPQLAAMEVKSDGSRRICRKSQPNVYKPDRAHFCKVLSSCVLKMDHFCPWLNNCIGFFNYKFFYLFIMYMVCVTTFMIYSMTAPFVQDVSSDSAVYIDFSKEFRVTLTYLVLCLLAIALTCFFCFHTYLLCFNYSTIEFLEKRSCNPPPDHVNRYDLGLFKNVASVLGTNPLFWLLPTRCTCEGDGLSYELNPSWYPSKGR